MVLQQEIEKVQDRTARLVTNNYCFETGSMTGILEKVKWESLKKKGRQQTDSFVQRSKGAASIPTDDLIPPIRHSRNHHSLTFRTPLQELTFTRAHSSHKQSEIGMPFQIRSLPLLKVQRMVWLGLHVPLW